MLGPGWGSRLAGHRDQRVKRMPEPSRVTPEPFAVAPAAADYAQAPAGLVLFCVAVLERVELLADTLRRRFKRSPGEAE